MAAQSFKEWFDIVTDVGELDPFSGFTSKGVAHIAWDAAIKSLDGVQNQSGEAPVQQLKPKMPSWVDVCADIGLSTHPTSYYEELILKRCWVVYEYIARHFGH